MAEASVPEATGASAPSQNAAPTLVAGLVAGQKRPAEVIDLVDEESPKRRKKKSKKTKSRKGSKGSVASAPASLEDGELADSSTSSLPSRPDSAASDITPAVPPGGWNTGVSSGLRISFGAKADKAPSKPAPGLTESKDEQAPAASTSLVDDWQWPLHSLISFAKPPRKDDNTKARFSRWYAALAEANKTRDDIEDPALVKEAWGVWLRRHPEMSSPKWVGSAERDVASVLDPKAFPAFVEELAKNPPGPPKEPPKVEEKEQATGLKVKGQAAAQRAEKEAAAKEAAARAKEAAAKEAKEAKDEAARAKEEAVRAKEEAARRAEDASREKHGDAGSPPEEGEALSPDQEEHTTLSPEELRYLQTYFPGVSPRERFCVSCAEYGHYQTDCQPCSNCSSWTHRSYQCHTLWRCERCDQTGHGREACPAKLAAAPEEKGACTFCRLPHNERQCPLLSQSYVFDAARAHKIKAFTPSCYHCGGRGHFGTQCVSNPQRLPDDLPSAAETWSMQNLLQYIDAEAEDFGIEGAARPPSRAGGAPPTHAPRNHIFFEEADDDEDDNEPFLRPSVKRQGQGQQGGQMSFAPPGRTMFSGPPGTNGSSSFNPPLPLGPPPPLPPPASSLPPLPAGPPPPRQQRRAPSSRGRGRGGGGGRGGRGRGR